MRNFYHEFVENPEDEYLILSVDDMWAFVEKTIRKFPKDLPIEQCLLTVRFYLVLTAFKHDYDQWISARRNQNVPIVVEVLKQQAVRMLDG